MAKFRFDAEGRLTKGRFGRVAMGTAATIAIAAVGLAAWSAQSEAQDPKPEGKKAAKARKEAESPAQAAPAAQAAAPAAAAPRTETMTYDQWTVVCQMPADLAAKRNCSAVLKVVDPNRHQVVFAWVLARTPDGKIATVMQAPTGVQVQRGLTLKLGDAGQPRVMPFASCEPQNCEVDQVMDEAAQRELEAAPQAVATIVAKDGRGIQFTMPLKGIDKALAAVRT